MSDNTLYVTSLKPHLFAACTIAQKCFSGIVFARHQYSTMFFVTGWSGLFAFRATATLVFQSPNTSRKVRKSAMSSLWFDGETNVNGRFFNLTKIAASP